MSQYEERTKVCPSCKREIGYYETTCSYCRQELEVAFDDARGLYIKENVGTYLRKFAKLEGKQGKTGWNWCSFLFGSNWMFYRKMYKEGLFFLFVPEIITWISYLLIPAGDKAAFVAVCLNFILTLALWIATGLFGDYWYKRKVEALVVEGNGLDDAGKAALAKRKGGTSGLMIILSMVIGLVLGAITMGIEGMLGL